MELAVLYEPSRLLKYTLCRLYCVQYGLRKALILCLFESLVRITQIVSVIGQIEDSCLKSGLCMITRWCMVHHSSQLACVWSIQGRRTGQSEADLCQWVVVWLVLCFVCTLHILYRQCFSFKCLRQWCGGECVVHCVDDGVCSSNILITGSSTGRLW